MKNIYPWLFTRVTLIKANLIDFAIFISIILIYKNLLTISFHYVLFIFLFWLFLNYSYERYYDLINISKNLNLKSIAFYILKCLILSSLTFIFTLLLKKFDNNIFFQIEILIKILIFFNMISTLVQLIIFKFSKIRSSVNWIVFGKNKLPKIITEDYFVKRNNYSFYEYKNIDITSNKFDSDNFNGVIVLDKDFDDNSIKEKIKLMKEKDLSIFSLKKWSKLYLEIVPPNLFSNKKILLKRRTKKNFLQNIIKRIGDLFLGSLLLLVTLPIILISIIIIYLQDKGPVFYSQKRTGLNGKTFNILKLRSMKVNAEKSLPQWSTSEDKRITRFGKLLRLTRIDELPQLISVLKGEMSLIGPRPERPEFDAKLRESIPNYMDRYILKPGLSGWAQVNYPYGASIDDTRVKLSFDLYYLENISIGLDFLILFKTIRLILNARGAIALKLFR